MASFNKKGIMHIIINGSTNLFYNILNNFKAYPMGTGTRPRKAARAPRGEMSGVENLEDCGMARRYRRVELIRGGR